MVGSDQVWNTQAALSSVYFLDFVPDEKRKITYASSFGTSTIDKKYNNEVRRLLNRFDQIAVRESFGQNYSRLVGEEGAGGFRSYISFEQE